MPLSLAMFGPSTRTLISQHAGRIVALEDSSGMHVNRTASLENQMIDVMRKLGTIESRLDRVIQSRRIEEDSASSNGSAQPPPTEAAAAAAEATARFHSRAYA